MHGPWQPAGERTWKAPACFDPADASTESWLALGGWMAYAAPAPVDDADSLFDVTPGQAIGWAARHRVAVAIESYFDDLEWRVLVGGWEPSRPATGGRGAT